MQRECSGERSGDCEAEVERFCHGSQSTTSRFKSIFAYSAFCGVLEQVGAFEAVAEPAVTKAGPGGPPSTSPLM